MVIAVDFDGTIVEHQYPRIGRDIPFAVDVLKRLQEEEGHTLILWTVRDGDLLSDAVQYCLEKGLRFFAVNENYPEEDKMKVSRKLTADLFIDDRNFGGLPDWGIIYKLIKSGKFNAPYFSMDEWNDEEYTSQKKSQKNFFIRLGEALDRARGKSY